jgi:hypothetical protein
MKRLLAWPFQLVGWWWRTLEHSRRMARKSRGYR